VISETAISLASMADPHQSLQGKLLSLEGRYAEVVLDAELKPGSLVQFQSSETLYLGEIESGWTEAGAHRLRVLIEHSVNLERAAAIRRLWNTDSPF
jgi:hypothetical protein